MLVADGFERCSFWRATSDLGPRPIFIGEPLITCVSDRVIGPVRAQNRRLYRKSRFERPDIPSGFDVHILNMALVRGSANVRYSVFDGPAYLVAPVEAWQRTDFGRPQASIRFKMATPIAASVC